MELKDKHIWKKKHNDEDGNKVWICSSCKCKKTLGNYKYASPSFIRSGQITQYRPNCTEMGRRSQQNID